MASLRGGYIHPGPQARGEKRTRVQERELDSNHAGGREEAPGTTVAVLPESWL